MVTAESENATQSQNWKYTHIVEDDVREVFEQRLLRGFHNVGDRASRRAEPPVGAGGRRTGSAASPTDVAASVAHFSLVLYSTLISQLVKGKEIRTGLNNNEPSLVSLLKVLKKRLDLLSV